MKKPSSSSQPCPCGNAEYETCCAPLHRGEAASNAEALMRSRYSAYALGLEDYLLATWHASTRPAALNLAQGITTTWLGLRIEDTQRIDDDHATVSFTARWRAGGGSAQRMHERSLFIRDGRWYYVDGDVS